MKKEKINDNIKELNKNQKWYYEKIIELGKDKKVKQISYDELFAVLDRVKFCYFLNLVKMKGKIKLIKS